MAQTSYPFTIPFGFTVGAKSLAPGDYQVTEVLPYVVVLQSRDGHSAVITMCHPVEPWKTGKALLGFHKYGNRYFLSEFRNPNRGSELTVSAEEKELIAGRSSPKGLNVVAFSGR